ncbi:CD276 antigen homolog [Carassius carassius]|uniref:CD276 antigen homolog n=1 Tax=Carassius carassius TaxID=217509 RepID=UPI0028696177|nr:CD276 antigen homolog [Carassius carassius]
MITRFYFICVSALLIQKVSLQVTVDGFIGGSVLLPCSSSKHDLKLQDINVHWRHNDSKLVFDIIKGEDSVEQQDPRYKNRVKPFSEEYKRGNFSIRLTDLNHTDAGRYTCFIPHSSEYKTVELIIKEPTTGSGPIPADQETQKPGTDGVTSPSLLWVYITVPVVILILIMMIVCFLYRNTIKDALFSPVTTENKEPTEINV